MNYFSQFPKTVYNFDSSSTSVNYVVNILLRNAFIQGLLQNTTVYYQYAVKDTDTAEIIADKYYGDPNRYWVILLFNQLFDPYFDFPMNNEQFENYIIANYGSVQAAQQTLKQVEKTIDKTTIYIGGFTESQNTETFIISGNTSQTYNYSTGQVVPVSYPAINSPPVTYTYGPYTIGNEQITINETYASLSVYDYEFRENEKKKIINLLDASYINLVEKQFKDLIQNGS